MIAARGFRVEDRVCGAAYVFERKDDVWTQTQRLDAPRTDLTRFGRLVGVSGGAGARHRAGAAAEVVATGAA